MEKKKTTVNSFFVVFFFFFAFFDESIEMCFIANLVLRQTSYDVLVT